MRQPRARPLRVTSQQVAELMQRAWAESVQPCLHGRSSVETFTLEQLISAVRERMADPSYQPDHPALRELFRNAVCLSTAAI